MSQYPPQPQYPQQPGQPHQQPQYQYPGQQTQQYPYSPYAMPQGYPGYAQAYGDNSGKYGRAATMLFVTGGLFSVCGLGCVGLAFSAPWEQAVQQAMQQMGQVDPQVQRILTPQNLQRIVTGLGVGEFIYGLLAIILGIFVRRGSRGATMTATIVTGLLLLGNLLALCSGFVGQGARAADIVVTACMLVVPFALFVWQFIWLIQALRAGPMMQANQGQMQYWQHIQMQQQYQQAYQNQNRIGAPQPPGQGGMQQPPAPPPGPPPPEPPQNQA